MQHSHTTALCPCIPDMFSLSPGMASSTCESLYIMSLNSKWHPHLFRSPVIFTHPSGYLGHMACGVSDERHIWHQLPDCAYSHRSGVFEVQLQSSITQHHPYMLRGSPVQYSLSICLSVSKVNVLHPLIETSPFITLVDQITWNWCHVITYTPLFTI